MEFICGNIPLCGSEHLSLNKWNLKRFKNQIMIFIYCYWWKFRPSAGEKSTKYQLWLRPPSWWNWTFEKTNIFFFKYLRNNFWEKYLKLSQTFNSTHFLRPPSCSIRGIARVVTSFRPFLSLCNLGLRFRSNSKNL